jgi:hypothetical protein
MTWTSIPTNIVFLFSSKSRQKIIFFSSRVCRYDTEQHGSLVAIFDAYAL